MMRYTVVWTEGAADELAELWLSAPDRAAVTSAADAADSRLRDDAGSQGTEVSEGLRALFVPPLCVLFAANEADALAEVLRVRRL